MEAWLILSHSHGLTSEGIPFWLDCLDLVSRGPPSPSEFLYTRKLDTCI
uniref:Uncharacterized protein n=1 Tax=Arundo donax TaxID=35708 RepID=A0A0A9AR81_ARUDO